MSSQSRPAAFNSRVDFLVAVLIFIFTLLIFWFSPVHQVTDSHYSMMLSEDLLKHRSFALDHFNLPRLEPNVSTRDYYVMNGDIWQLERARGHIYYYFPPGSSVLSLPAVAIANTLGVSAVNDDGTYNPRGEIAIETSIAAILMAVTAVIFFFTSRLLLPSFWSVVIALSAALGTQLWSTASRGLWSHTWCTFLVALLVWMLLTDETGKRKINGIVLASLLVWLYFVRPTGILILVAVTIYLLLRWRVIPNRWTIKPKEDPAQQQSAGRTFVKYAITVFVWLSGFVVYSWIHFGKPLPSYYQANRLRFDLFPVALAGNLAGPARGLFVYVPATLLVGYLVVRYWKQLPFKGLAWLGISICVFYILVVSAFANLWGDWWGGASFGPRYTTELAPWFVLLAILGLKARLTSTKTVQANGAAQTNLAMQGNQATQANSLRYVAEIVIGSALVAISVFINARGAMSVDTWKWSQPSTDQQLRAQLWNWRHPQFLAGLQSPPPPVEVPIAQKGITIDFTSPEVGPYLWYGWSGAEKNLRWSDGREAAVVFGLNQIEDMLLEVRMAPFLAPPRLSHQKVMLKLNGHDLEMLSLADDEMRSYSVRLPGDLLAARNVLTFSLPDACSPESLGVGLDDRVLGIKVESMQIR